MLEFLNNNKQRILSPAIITLALYVIAVLEVPSKYNYLVPSISELLIALLFVCIVSCQERLGKWRGERLRNFNYNKLKNKLNEKLDMKKSAADLGKEALRAIDAQAASILEEMHKYEADEIKANRDEYEEITNNNEKLKKEKEKYRREATESANAFLEKLHERGKELK